MGSTTKKTLGSAFYECVILQFTPFSTRLFTIACSFGENMYSDYVYQCFEFCSSICSFTSLKLWRSNKHFCLLSMHQTRCGTDFMSVEEYVYYIAGSQEPKLNQKIIVIYNLSCLCSCWTPSFLYFMTSKRALIAKL